MAPDGRALLAAVPAMMLDLISAMASLEEYVFRGVVVLCVVLGLIGLLLMLDEIKRSGRS